MNKVHIRRQIISWICILIMSLVWPAVILAESTQDSVQNEAAPELSLEVTAEEQSEDGTVISDEETAEADTDIPRTMLFFIVSDYGKEDHVLTDEAQRREFTLAMMNAATALYESGLVTDIAIDATQRLDEHGDVASAMIKEPEYAAEAILTFMQNVQPSKDAMSNKTARDIERILAYCKEQEICPWIVMAYGDDLSKFAQISITRPEDMAESRICYVWGETEPNLSALEKAWGDSVESTTVQELNTLLAPEIQEMSLYEIETEKPEVYAEAKNGLLRPAKNTAFLDLLAVAGSETGDQQVYDWNPDEECMVEEGAAIGAVYYRKDKEAIVGFEQYVAQVKDQLEIEVTDGEYSLSVPLSEKYGIEVQVYRSGSELMDTAVLHEEGQKIEGDPVCLWAYAPGKMGTYHLNMVFSSDLLEENISLAEWKGSTRFIEIRNSAPEVTGQSGDRGTFVYLPQENTEYEVIDLRDWYRDRDGQELSFFLKDGREIKSGRIAVGICRKIQHGSKSMVLRRSAVPFTRRMSWESAAT